MGYFPFFMDIEGKNGLIAGGGRIALHKLQKLLPYGAKLMVVTPRISAQEGVTFDDVLGHIFINKRHILIVYSLGGDWGRIAELNRNSLSNLLRFFRIL